MAGSTGKSFTVSTNMVLFPATSFTSSFLLDILNLSTFNNLDDIKGWVILFCLQIQSATDVFIIPIISFLYFFFTIHISTFPISITPRWRCGIINTASPPSNYASQCSSMVPDMPQKYRGKNRIQNFSFGDGWVRFVEGGHFQSAYLTPYANVR